MTLDASAAEPPLAGEELHAMSGEGYGRYYYAHNCGIPYERNDHWLDFFEVAARSLVRELRPASALDAGCAYGMLVERLRAHGVEAYGFDLSKHAIQSADPSVEPFLWVGSLLDELPRRYDLITCIEVLEHLEPADIGRALDNLAAATDQLLVCSTPIDYREPTHLSVRAPEEWAADLAKRGFYRDLSFDASFLTPWAMLFRRHDAQPVELVRGYERTQWRLRAEVNEVRHAILSLHEQLEAQQEFLDACSEDSRRDVEQAREEALVMRDELIGVRAELGEALGQVRALEVDVLRLRTAAHELDRFRRAPVWRVYSPYQRVRSAVGRRLRAIFSRLS